ncbi:aromatic-amino-acid transaminase [Sphingomonas sp. YR710]|nr:aromatic-amino-acid transaminase [Sphingomonas sp. YR710]
MFAGISVLSGDPLYEVAARYVADLRPQRIDLGVGVYRDGSGRAPVMKAVKRAERCLVDRQETKAYRPLLGDPAFLRTMNDLVLGADCPALAEHRIVAIQTVGGTGALRLAAALAGSASTEPRIHLGAPTWPSHAGVFAAESVVAVEHAYWERGANAPLVDQILIAARNSSPNDLFLFHGPCHNPTGVDLSMAERREALAILQRTGAVPMLDIAYYGLGSGIDDDLEIARDMVARSQRAMIALSCSKAFGLYRERVGALFVLCADAGEAVRVRDKLGRLSRLMVSTPPAHGAEAVAMILDNPDLTQAWRDELAGMRDRIIRLRARLAASGLSVLASLGDERGIFAMLPLNPAQVHRLMLDHAIHLPASGRANLVGMRDDDIPHFLAALEAVGCR